MQTRIQTKLSAKQDSAAKGAFFCNCLLQALQLQLTPIKWQTLYKAHCFIDLTHTSPNISFDNKENKKKCSKEKHQHSLEMSTKTSEKTF